MRSVALAIGVGACATSGSSIPASPQHDEIAVHPESTGTHAPEFREGNFPSAAIYARRTGRPLVVEIWAPWCPSCTSMRASAFEDAAVRAIASSYVWVAVDIDSEEGQTLARGWRVSAIPTIVVVDPVPLAIKARWAGELSGPEIATFLRTPPPTEPDPNELTAMFDAAPSGWPAAPFVAYERVYEARRRNDYAECIARASHFLDKLPAGNLRGGVASFGLSCARDAKPPRDSDAARFADAYEKDLDDASCVISPAARSDGYSDLQAARKAMGDTAGAERAIKHWLEFIERARAHAVTPLEQVVLTRRRVMALGAAGDRAAAIPALEEAERTLPDEINTPLTLARELVTAGRLDEALAAYDRVITKAPWPRRLEAQWEKATVFRKKNDLHAEADLLDVAIAGARDKKLTRRFAAVVEKMKRRRAELAE